MRIRIILSMLLLIVFMFINLSAQTMPLVYDVENTTANYPKPPLPPFNQLPFIQALPDPFVWADSRGRISNFSDWRYRRAEIDAQVQNYEIGLKPAVDLSQVTASYSGGTLTVNVNVNGIILTLTSQVILPAGNGPFPAVIGMNSPSGSIPSSIFTSRNIVQITFNTNQVSTYGSPNNTNPYYRLYPYLNTDNTGQYSAWAWGVSRIIDGLELVQNVLPIDLKHIAVTGCSYAGKMALFAGALDERVALTIAQESGGGGATSWRYSHSEPVGSVECIDNTDYNWFMNSMSQFSHDNVSRLPEDHHELMAMCAPRALYVTANPDYTWLSNPSCYVCSKACQPVYNALGIADRFGFSIVGGHMHCAVPSNQIPEIEAFVDKFLLGKDTVNTNIADNYYNIDLSPWITWTTPTLSNGASIIWTSLIYPSNFQKDLDKTITFKWNKVKEAGKYFIQLSTDSTFTNINISDSTTTDTIKTITNLLDGKKYFWRVQVQNIAGTSGPFSDVWNFSTFIPLPAVPQLAGVTLYPDQPGWVTFEWNKAQYADQYLVQLAFVESFAGMFYSDTASDNVKTVTGLDEGRKYYWRVQAKNITGSSSWSASNFTLEIPTEYSISQNYPNPFNPSTVIEFTLPREEFVTLKVYNTLGSEVVLLVNQWESIGKHMITFDARNLASGVYYYCLKAGQFTETKKLVLMK